MLKRIRKTSKQMSRGKSSSSLDDLDNGDPKPQGDNDKPQQDRDKSDTKKAQGDRDKPQLERKKSKKERKAQGDQTKEETDSLKKEITSLQEVVTSLKDELEKEKSRYAEIKVLKTQQISALTVKLATAMRQKEKAESEVSRAQEKLQNGNALPDSPQVDQRAESELLKSEVDYLRDEVRRLEEQLQAESSQQGVLTDLSTQLSTAMRQREEALAEAFREKLDSHENKAQATGFQVECDRLRNDVAQLQGEVKRLNDNLDHQERSKAVEISELGEQMATVTRQREEALEEVEKLRAELNLLRATADEPSNRGGRDSENNQDIRQAADNVQEDVVRVGEDIVDVSRDSSSQGNEGVELKRSSSTERCFRLTGFPVKSPSEQIDASERDWDRKRTDLINGHVMSECEIQAVAVGTRLERLPSNLSASELSDFTDSTDNFSDSESDSYGRKVVSEFQRIQAELSEVKQSMSVVQSLNERLSGDLEVLEAKRKAGYRGKSGSLRRRKMATSESDAKGTAGSAPTKFIFPVDTASSKITATPQDKNSPNGGGTIASENTTDDTNKTSFSSAYEQWKDKEIDVKKQLLRALNELDNLRNDNREIKDQMKVIAASTAHHDHDDFLLKTTQYTDELLREMRARDLQIKKSCYVEDSSKMTPRFGLGNEFTGDDNSTSSLVHTDSGYLGDTSLLTVETRIQTPSSVKALETSPAQYSPLTTKRAWEESVSRPQSAGPAAIKAETTESLQQSSAKGHHRYSVPSKLGEPVVDPRLDRSDGLLYRMNRGVDIWGERVKKPLELSKGWKSTDSLSRQYNPPGYRDYLQRHIVRSSNSIAKIRDLTSEELYQMAI